MHIGPHVWAVPDGISQATLQDQVAHAVCHNVQGLEPPCLQKNCSSVQNKPTEKSTELLFFCKLLTEHCSVQMQTRYATCHRVQQQGRSCVCQVPKQTLHKTWHMKLDLTDTQLAASNCVACKQAHWTYRLHQQVPCCPVLIPRRQAGWFTCCCVTFNLQQCAATVVDILACPAYQEKVKRVCIHVQAKNTCGDK